MDLFKGYWEDLTIPKEWECNAFHHNTAPSWVFGELELFVNHPDGYNTEGKLPSGTPRFIIMNEDRYEFKTNNFKDAIQVMYNHASRRACDCVKARREKNMVKITVIDKVLEQIKEDVDMGDMTAIAELLSEVPEKTLKGFCSFVKETT